MYFLYKFLYCDSYIHVVNYRTRCRVDGSIELFKVTFTIYTWKMLRVDIKHCHNSHTQKMNYVRWWMWMCYLDLVNHSMMFFNHNIVHFIYNYICQLLLNKLEIDKKLSCLWLSNHWVNRAWIENSKVFLLAFRLTQNILILNFCYLKNTLVVFFM